jgi:hypothetical protein
MISSSARQPLNVQRRALQALVVFGVLGFLGASLLPYAGTWLARVELPTFFETSTIALPDGGRMTATMPTQRVQRYGSDGHFQTGWFVDAKGGHFAIGLTTDGRVAVCTGRGRQIFFFELDGQPVGDPRACFSAPREVPKILQPADFPLGDVNLQPAVSAERPTASLVAILLVPFWHPFVAWLIALVGFLGLRFGRRAPTG